MVSLDRLNGSCNTLDNSSGRICDPNKMEDIKLKCIQFDNKNKWIENTNKTYFMQL